MKTDKEITIELAKNKADEFLIKKELDIAKQQFINELKNGLGEEIKTNTKDLNKPIKLKKPFKLKIKDFFRRISKVLGNE
jgi:hypothetical protein